MLVKVATLHALISAGHVNPQVEDPAACLLFLIECFVQVVLYSSHDVRLSPEVACVPRLVVYFLRCQLFETTPILE